MREIGLAPRGDLVDLLHFGLDRVDQLLAAGNGLDVPFEPFGELLDFRQPGLDCRELLFAEGHLCAALLELLEHLFGARELILGGLIWPTASRCRLCTRSSSASSSSLMAEDRASSSDKRLHLARALGDLGRDRLARRHQLGEPLLLLRDGRFVVLDAADALVRRLDLRPEHVDLGDERHQAGLERTDVVQLVLGVHHLLGQAVARRLERLELRAPRELIFQLPIDVGADGVQAVQARLQLFDERDARCHPRELRVELGHGFVQPRGLLRAFLDQRHLAEDGVHLRLELGSARGQPDHPFVEGLERDAVGAQLVAQLGDFGVRLVEVEDLLPQRVRDPVGSA